ncbi:hypothetical protein BOTBODRAFT_38438 [Botryobasidium botryosum FD-172 SS1]|uniref:Transcription factor domain-containing protein n=1 Tax=Botryobasidium botryosum (strain FD-172 SS1) TaxID=930990 RepID=A0A067M8I2_BOTB1|nr:hypothetical protein BOTBODRAFT_38438 [Botryobasidium botryosum FD-172 SS1]
MTSETGVPRYMMTSPIYVTPSNPTGLIARRARDALIQSIRCLGVQCPAGHLGVECRWWELDELPRCYKYHLIDCFLHYRFQSGIELHIPRFLASLSLPPDEGPHPALIDAMCLVACALSRKPYLRKHEPYILSQARAHLDQSLAEADRLFDFIRASALLSRYYALRGRFQEGFITISACAKLTIACGLHKIASRVWSDPRARAVPGSSLLKPPRDPVELAERILGFWAVFVIERMYTIHDRIPSAFVDDEIETVFPLPLSYFEMEPEMVVGFPEYSLRDIFEPDSGAMCIPNEWPYTRVLKGMALSQRVANLRALADVVDFTGSKEFWRNFWAIDRIMQDYIEVIGVLPSMTVAASGGKPSPSAREINLAFIYVQLHAAVIHLHEPFIAENDTSHRRCMGSLEVVVQIACMIEDVDPRYTYSLYICMRTAYDFLIREMDRRREKGDPVIPQLEVTRQRLSATMVRLAPFRIIE